MILRHENAKTLKLLSDLDFAFHSKPGDAKDTSVFSATRGIESLEDAITCWAQILKLEYTDPDESRKLTDLLVRYKKESPDTDFPSLWLDRADTIASRSARSIELEVDIPNESDIDQIYSTIKSDSNAPTVMAEVFGLIGAKQIKREFARLYFHSKLAKDYDASTLPAFSYNAIFDGSNGTGKSCVARMYFNLMKQLGVIHETSIFIDVTGAPLMDRGPAGLQQQLRSIRGAKGAVVRIGDAHQLLTSQAGRQALASILPLAAQHDTEYGRIVWILAGPSAGIGALLAAHAGLRGRFPVRMHFNDLTEEELLAVFLSKLKLYKRASTVTEQVASG